MTLRHSDRYFAVLALLATLAAAALLHARHAVDQAQPQRERNRALVARLGLTDLCLTTEAPYTRHPALADHYAPFQDHPAAREHYPSGSIIAPPPGY